MLKVILVLLAILGAALYFPQTRPYIIDTVEPVLTPVFEWSTKGEMRKIVRDLESRVGTGLELPPNQEHFQAWVGRQYTGEDATIDSWRNPYRLEIGRSSFTVRSFGPDGVDGTGDDIVVTGQIPDDIPFR